MPVAANFLGFEIKIHGVKFRRGINCKVRVKDELRI